MIGRKKWILFLVIPQLYVCHTSTRRHHKVPRLIFSLVIFTSSLVLIVKFTIPYRLDVRLIIASVVSPAPLISTDRGSCHPKSDRELLSESIVTIVTARQVYRSKTG